MRSGKTVKMPEKFTHSEVCIALAVVNSHRSPWRFSSLCTVARSKRFFVHALLLPPQATICASDGCSALQLKCSSVRRSLVPDGIQTVPLRIPQNVTEEESHGSSQRVQRCSAGISTSLGSWKAKVTNVEFQSLANHCTLIRAGLKFVRRH